MPELHLTARPFGATGVHVSPLGLSELFIPHRGGSGPRMTPGDVERAFHEHGVNTFFVHTRMKRICEGVRRLIRAGYRDQLVLASAASLPLAGSMRRGLEKHLWGLGTDHLDLWFLGWLRKSWYARESVWSEMCRLREKGMTRGIGFSSHNRRLAARLARELPADFIMIRYNAAHRGAEEDIFAPLESLGPDRPGIIAYTATRWSMLLRPLPKRGFPKPMTAPECYRFVLEHPAVDTVWCGARNLAELTEDVAGVLEGPLPPERREEVRRFGDAVHAGGGGTGFVYGSGED